MRKAPVSSTVKDCANGSPLRIITCSRITSVTSVTLVILLVTFVTLVTSVTSVTFVISFVILGGISRIGKVASKIAPVMVLVYMATVFYLMFLNYEMIIPSFKLIFTDAFSANSVLGGSVISIIMIGARRASFSNRVLR